MGIKRLSNFFKEMSSQSKFTNVKIAVTKALENYKRANSSMWVNSLCFYTILAMVPMFAILFSLGSWLGINDYFLRKIIEYSPLNEESVELLVRFARNFIENTRTGVLAGLGFLTLGWTLISMFSIIEKSFNNIWRVSKNRMLLRKITDYISFIVLFPILLGISSGALRLLTVFGYNNSYLRVLEKVIPFFTLMIFFTILYMIIPNTKVNFIPAFISSIFISLFFCGFQSLFILLQGMVNTYDRIYGSFSVVFIFLFWLRIMWFFLILGAHSSYYLQNRDMKLLVGSVDQVSFLSKEYVAVAVIDELVKRHILNLPPITLKELVQVYGFPYEVVKKILSIFIKAGFVGQIGNGEEKSYVIIKNVDTIDFKTIYSILERSGSKICYNSSRIEKLIDVVTNKNFDYKFKDE